MSGELEPGALVTWQPEPGKGFVHAGVVTDLAPTPAGTLVAVDRRGEIVDVEAEKVRVYAASYNEWVGRHRG